MICFVKFEKVRGVLGGYVNKGLKPINDFPLVEKQHAGGIINTNWLRNRNNTENAKRKLILNLFCFANR